MIEEITIKEIIESNELLIVEITKMMNQNSKQPIITTEMINLQLLLVSTQTILASQSIILAYIQDKKMNKKWILLWIVLEVITTWVVFDDWNASVDFSPFTFQDYMFILWTLLILMPLIKIRKRGN